MKKNALIAVCMIMLSVFSMTFTSCGDDDDDEPVLVTPKYAENAVRYEISGTSEFSAIEFTEGGMYVITKAYNSGNIHGKYTKNGDVYTLEGFGTVTVEKTDGKISLKIQPTGKKAYTLSAYTTDKLEETDISDKLCRTWKFKKGRLVVKKGDSVILDTISTKTSVFFTCLDSIYHQTPDSYDDGASVIFTKSGSYIAGNTNNTMSVAQWKWKDDNKGTIYYTWNYGKFDEEKVIEVSFDKNNNLVVVEECEDTYKGEKYTAKYIYNFSETE